MKRWSILLVMILFGSVYGHAQFWINFGWNEPYCENCHWMERAIRMTSRQAAEYHKIIHKYGQKIEREARKDYRYWDKAAEKIYKLRMERDRKLQRVLSPSQFNLYVRYVRENPTRIHDWKGWFNNPHYPNYRPSAICHHYESHYWNPKRDPQPHKPLYSYKAPQHPNKKQNYQDGKPQHGNKPGNNKSPNHTYKNKPQKDKYDKKQPNPGKEKGNNRDNKDRKSNNRSSKEHTNRR